jgi:methylglutaconyl-CoA hydratase
VVAKTVDGVRTLTLNRPDKRNAIDSTMLDALHDAFEKADLDADARVIVLKGAGKDFCGGMDLNELLASADKSAEENTKAAMRFGDVFIRMRRLPKPVVAVVQGRALAGGCGLATACDLVLGLPGSQYGYPEIQRGFVPAMVIAMLTRAVGEKVAYDLAATGRVLSAEEAAAAGLIARVVPDEAAAAQVVTQLMGSGASALALVKQQLYAVEGRSFEEAIKLGAEVNALARSTPEFKSAIKAFLKK